MARATVSVVPGARSPAALSRPTPGGHAAARAHAVDRAAPPQAKPLAFVLFILVNATLFIRPAELIKSLEGWPIYNVLMIACLAVSLPTILRQLAWRALSAQPGVLCVVLLLPALIVSHLTHFDFYNARAAASNFVKVIIYFLMLIAVVDSVPRLRIFVTALVIFIVGVATIAVLQHHGVLDIEAVAALERGVGYDEEAGEREVLMQLRGPGIFNDPNDFSLILVTGMVFAAHGALQSRGWLGRILCLGVAVALGYPFSLTHSRGGLLALLASLGAMMVGRIGIKRSIPVGMIALPALLVVFAGRQTNINFSDENDTSVGRVLIWRDGMMLFQRAPIFGIGVGNFGEEAGIVAHNSFVQCYTEMGIVGGTVFTSAVYLPIWILMRKHADARAATEAGRLSAWRPVLLASLAGYTVGMCSLTRSYTVSTYLLFGLGAVYARLLAAGMPGIVPAVSWNLVGRLAGVGVGVFAFFYVVVRVIT